MPVSAETWASPSLLESNHAVDRRVRRPGEKIRNHGIRVADEEHAHPVHLRAPKRVALKRATVDGHPRLPAINFEGSRTDELTGPEREGPKTSRGSLLVGRFENVPQKRLGSDSG